MKWNFSTSWAGAASYKIKPDGFILKPESVPQAARASLIPSPFDTCEASVAYAKTPRDALRWRAAWMESKEK